MDKDDFNPANNVADVINERNQTQQPWLRMDVLHHPQLWDTSQPAVDGALRSTLMNEEEDTEPKVTYAVVSDNSGLDFSGATFNGIAAPPTQINEDMYMLYLTYNMQMVLAFVLFAALVYALANNH